MPVTGIVDAETWRKINDIYLGIIRENPPDYRIDTYIPYPGEPLVIGSTGAAVRVIQERLAYISQFYESIPTVEVTGYFGEDTQNAVNAFLTEFGLPPKGFVGPGAWQKIEKVYLDLLNG